MTALVCTASVAGLSAADATRFSFDFTAPTYFFSEPGDTATGSGFIDADDNGDGSFTITDVIGTVYPYDGANGRQIDDFFGGDLFAGMLTPTINAVGNIYQLDNLGIAFGGFLSFVRQQDGTYSGGSTDGGSVSGASFNVALAPSAAPETATWVMLVLGFGAAGAAMRRRTRVRFA
jgi:hypothetical protein